MSREYTVHGFPKSLFTRKLEAALRFYEAPFHLESKGIGEGDEVEQRAQTHQIPVLHTPENWMIADTTPLLDLLDARFPARRLFPEGPLGVLVHIVEEVLDEWIARVMVHFRWHYAENTRHIVSTFAGREVSPEEAAEFPLAKWGPRACRATGTESEFHQQAAEAEYIEILGALEQQLASTRYALGDRPTAVDTILLGGLRAHINADPIPELSRFPRATAWDESGADPWAGDGEWAAFPQSTPFAAHMLVLARDQYLPFVLANAKALKAGDKAFQIETYGQTASYLTRPYPEQSRQQIHERITQRLTAEEQERVAEWLAGCGLAEAFLP